MKNKKLLGIIIALLLCILAIPLAGFAATDKVEFKTWDDTQKKMVDAFVGTGEGTKSAEYTEISASSVVAVTWNAGWYVVTGGNESNPITIPGVTVNGDVHLILKDGCNLTVNGSGLNNAGITVSDTNNSLTIYGQTDSTGKLTANSGDWGAGIGGCYKGDGKNITINGGEVTANSKDGGAGIGGGFGGNGSSITINGGKVNATAGEDIYKQGAGAGIGGGGTGNGENITINGGKVTANGSTNKDYYSYESAGIGGGYNGDGKNIKINGGNVIATGGDENAAGIGGGKGGSASDIKAADAVLVKAGDSEKPETVIEHNATDDLASKTGFLKRYVTAVGPVTYKVTCEGTDETTPNSLKYALVNIKAGDIIQLDADIDLSATLDVVSGKNFILDLNGHVLKANATDTKKFSVITNAGTLTIIDSSKTESSEGTGKITGGNKEKGGGIDNTGNLTFNGGNITGNSAKEDGGGVYNEGDFTMNGGNITGNSTKGKGGGVNNQSTFIMSGGNITGNSATERSGGVHNYGTMKVSGKPVVTGNQSGTSEAAKDENVYIFDEKTITVGTGTAPDIKYLEEGASIGVTTKTEPTVGSPVNFTGNNSADYSSYFFSDNSKFIVKDSVTDQNHVLQLLLPGISVGEQSGNLTYHTAGNATFTVTYTDFTSPSNQEVVWTEETAPTGVTSSFEGTDKDTLKISTTAATPAGTYTFKVKAKDGTGSDEYTSAEATLTVTEAGKGTNTPTGVNTSSSLPLIIGLIALAVILAVVVIVLRKKNQNKQ